MERKRCSKKGHFKPASEFHLARRSKDARASRCKDCRREDYRKVRSRRCAYQRAYSARNSERCRVARARCRAHHAGVANDLTNADWLAQLNAFGWRCAYNEAHPFECMNHVTPLSKGGPNSKANVVPCCNTCNRTKSLQDWRHKLRG